MKKFFRGIVTFVLAFVILFTFTGCGSTALSATTVDTSKAEVNGESTNGGYTVIYDGYIYFINGTKDNDGTNLSGNTRGAIVRAKYNSDDATIDEDTYEVVVDSLVGYDFGSIYFFGNFMYYTTPCDGVNYQGTVLYYKIRFMRYDLVNKTTQIIYTTQQNTEDDELSYAYYITGSSLNLLVYESENESLTSILIGDEMTTNYVISDVQSCLFSENYGTCVTENATIDANTYVYYTLSHDTYDFYQSGVKVYRTLPNKNTSTCISDEGYSITLLCIRNGYLIYSSGSYIYYSSITGADNETLAVEISNIISYATYENVIFIENDDGSLSLLYLDDDTYQVMYIQWNNGVVLSSTIIGILDEPSDFSMVGLVTLDEEVADDSGADAEEDESEDPATKTESVTYLIYIESNVVYKLEISREGTLTKYSQPITLSTTTVVAASGVLSPEIIGTNLYIFGNELDEDEEETGNVYMFVIDLTPTEDVEDAGTMIGITED